MRKSVKNRIASFRKAREEIKIYYLGNPKKEARNIIRWMEPYGSGYSSKEEIIQALREAIDTSSHLPGMHPLSDEEKDHLVKTLQIIEDPTQYEIIKEDLVEEYTRATEARNVML